MMRWLVAAENAASATSRQHIFAFYFFGRQGGHLDIRSVPEESIKMDDQPRFEVGTKVIVSRADGPKNDLIELHESGTVIGVSLSLMTLTRQRLCPTNGKNFAPSGKLPIATTKLLLLGSLFLVLMKMSSGISAMVDLRHTICTSG